MVLSKKITKILTKNTPDLVEWVELLNFFKEEQKNLTILQKIRIFRKHQKTLDYWNTDRRKTVTLTRPNGELMSFENLEPGLGIKEEDINPQTIYTDEHIKIYQLILESSFTDNIKILYNYLITNIRRVQAYPVGLLTKLLS